MYMVVNLSRFCGPTAPAALQVAPRQAAAAAGRCLCRAAAARRSRPGWSAVQRLHGAGEDSQLSAVQSLHGRIHLFRAPRSALRELGAIGGTPRRDTRARQALASGGAGAQEPGGRAGQAQRSTTPAARPQQRDIQAEAGGGYGGTRRARSRCSQGVCHLIAIGCRRKGQQAR